MIEEPESTPLSGPQVQRIHDMYKDEAKQLRQNVEKTLKHVGYTAMVLFAAMVGVLAYFLGDRISQLDSTVDKRLTTTETRVNSFLQEVRETVNDRLTAEILSHKVNQRVIDETLKLASAAVNNAFSSPEVASLIKETESDLYKKISSNVSDAISKAIQERILLEIENSEAELNQEARELL